MRPLHPSLYQINTRVVLGELSRRAGQPMSLDLLPDAMLDEVAARGFDWFWPLGVWQTGAAAREVSRTNPEWRREFAATLPDLTDADISGSPFAITGYDVHADFGDDATLARLRERLRARGVKLLLDFVPNHTAPDHPWLTTNPECYVGGSEEDFAREPQNYYRVGGRIVARGRDPYFPGWPDTAQLNYMCRATFRAMGAELLRVADRCDGVRCDMAMLLLPDVIERTWGDRAKPIDGSAPVDESFWTYAISTIREKNPNFVMMAEVYWDLEWSLQQQGFDYTYDKRLYDRLHAGDAAGVRGHLRADAEFQRRSVRFLENHDEPRAASAFAPEAHEAAAAIALLSPGLRFFHEGQFEGRKVRVSMHLGRRPSEPVDERLAGFYEKLLGVLRSPSARDGTCRELECQRTWEGDATNERFVAFEWRDGGACWLIAVNYGPTPAQCLIPLDWPEWRGRTVVLTDALGEFRYERSGDELNDRGLYLAVTPWRAHVFAVG